MRKLLMIEKKLKKLIEKKIYNGYRKTMVKTKTFEYKVKKGNLKN